MKYRRRPIEAIQWTGDNFEECYAFATPPGELFGCLSQTGQEIVVETLEGRMRVSIGDWIIRGIAGELYPIKDEIFEATYEPLPKEEVRSE